METGTLVGGRYEIADVIGRGGMSTVYRAHDRVLERDVALKILHERHTTDPEHVERFRREARAIARLSHPNIVTVIDRGQVDDCEFIVFELVRGVNLKELLARRGPLPVAEALALAHQAGRGLALAHEHGIVHRDVKPQNVLVSEDGVAKVTDFGVARSLARDDGLTLTGTILGTGDYLSPEQALGRRVDARSDQYSLGALLYELLTGDVPYPAESTLVVATRHVNEPPPSVRQRRPDVSARVDGVVRRAMAKNPEERFPSMDAFLAALETAMAEDAVGGRTGDEGATVILPAPPAPSAAQRLREQEEPRRRRRRVPWPLVAGLAVLAVAALVVGALATGRWDPTGNGQASDDGRPVPVRAVSDYDPAVGDGEHPELVPAATDGNAATYWSTETYGSGFEKPGVGIILDAGAPRGLDSIVLVTDTPGFTAMIQAGRSPEGEFADVADERETSTRTRFELDTGGRRFRYYVVWITDLDEVAHVNEVRAR